jgi:TonB-linked SusC/RagA family outer membrane protein
MRTTILTIAVFFIFLGSLIAHESTAQDLSKIKVTLDARGKNLEYALKEIEKATNLRFAYNNDLLTQYNNVRIQPGTRSVKETLQLLLASTRLAYEQQNSYILIKAKESKPVPIEKTADIKITGTVKDLLNKELSGVSIKNLNTGKGTTTDDKGNYSIMASAGDVLEFSFVGYNPQQLIIKDLFIINVQLEASSGSLDDVVIIGYGQQKKVSQIGAQTTIKVDELKQPVANLSNSVAGRIAGIIGVQRGGEPGYDASQIYIRGISTYTNSSPLVLVDGVERSFNNIDPQDIASFSILKDASATAVYGVRGANGVILIETKKGKLGGPLIDFQFNQGITEFTKVPEFADGITYMQLANEASRNSAINNGTLASWKPLYSDEKIEATKNGIDPDLNPNIDWMDAIFKKRGQNRRGNLNLAGGSEKTKYYVSLAYYDETGLFRTDELAKYNSAIGFKRYNFTSNLNFQITKTTKLDFGVSGWIGNGNYPGNGTGTIYNSALRMTPISVPIRYSDSSFSQKAGSGSLPNPYNQLTQAGYVTEFRSQLWSNVRLTQDLRFWVPGLSITTMFSFDNYNQHNIRRTKSVPTYYATGRDANGKLQFTQVNQGNNFLSYERQNSGNRRFYSESAINYNKNFDKHEVSGLLLYNQSDYVEAFAGDFISSIPFRFQGFAGRVTYGYDTRYLAEVNFGYNGSETFAPGNRFGFFPSYGVGWVASNETWYQQHIADYVQFFKVRASYGVVGNSSIGGRRFAYITTTGGGSGGYSFGQNGNSNNSGGVDIGDYAVDVTWEKAFKYNLGFELKTINNALSLVVDLFRENRKGIYRQRGDVPQYVGVLNLPYANIAEIHNKGVDATIDYNKQITRDLYVGFRGNFTYTKSIVINTANAAWPYPWQNEMGQKFGARFGYIAEGIFQSEKEVANSPFQSASTHAGDLKYKDLNGDGRIDTYDRHYIGYGSLPEIVYGFGPTITFKQWSLGAWFKGISNVDIYLNGDGFAPFASGGEFGNIFTTSVDRWTPENPNPNATYPRLLYGLGSNRNYDYSSWWVRNGSYLRLQNLELSYTFRQKSWMKRLSMSTLRLYFLGYNVATFSPFKMWDVELGDGNGATYPLLKSYNLGLNVSFK